MSLGVAFSILSTIGSSPVTAIPLALTLITNIDIGIWTFIFNAALILAQLLILRSKFKKKRWLQFITCFIISYFTSLSLYMVSMIPFDGSVLMSCVFLALSILLIAFGIFVYFPTDIAPLPGEGFVESISIVTGWRFSTVKIGFDVTMVLSALIICGLWYDDIFGAVYLGTVISAVMVGFTLRQIGNLYTHITGRKVNMTSQ